MGQGIRVEGGATSEKISLKSAEKVSCELVLNLSGGEDVQREDIAL